MLLVIKDRVRTCYYNNKDFYIIDYRWNAYKALCIEALKKAAKQLNKKFYFPSCLICKVTGNFEFYNNGFIKFNSSIENTTEFDIELFDFACYDNQLEALRDVQEIDNIKWTWNRVVVLDLGNFIYKLHFLYETQKDKERVLLIEGGNKLEI